MIPPEVPTETAPMQVDISVINQHVGALVMENWALKSALETERKKNAALVQANMVLQQNQKSPRR